MNKILRELINCTNIKDANDFYKNHGNLGLGSSAPAGDILDLARVFQSVYDGRITLDNFYEEMNRQKLTQSRFIICESSIVNVKSLGVTLVENVISECLKKRNCLNCGSTFENNLTGRPKKYCVKCAELQKRGVSLPSKSPSKRKIEIL